MAEFILVTEFESDRQVLINTDEVQRVSQTVVDDVPNTYLTYRGYSTRIRETLQQVMSLLQAPWGRPYSYTPYNGVGGVVYQPPAQFGMGVGKL